MQYAELVCFLFLRNGDPDMSPGPKEVLLSSPACVASLVPFQSSVLSLYPSLDEEKHFAS